MCQNICHSGGQSKNVFNQVWCEHFCPDVLVRACFSHAMRFTRQGSDKTCFLSCASWIFGALLLEILGYVFGSKNEVYTIDVTELILNAVALDARRFQTIFCFSAVPEKKFGSLWVLECISYSWIVVFLLLDFDMTTLLSWKLWVFLESHTIYQWNPKSCWLVSPSNVMKSPNLISKIQMFQYTQYMFRTSLHFFVPTNPLLVNHI